MERGEPLTGAVRSECQTRARWRVIHLDGGHDLLVSHGLSDVFISRMEPSVGLGLELCLETDEPLTHASNWPFLLLERVAHEVALHESLREQARARPVRLELSGQGLPDALVTATGQVAVSLGEPPHTRPHHFSTPYGEVQLLTVRPLRSPP